MAQGEQVWTVAEAKARLSEVMAEAERKGPQVITRKGRRSVVVVSASEWDERTAPREPLADFLLRGPDLPQDVVEAINARAKTPGRSQDF